MPRADRLLYGGAVDRARMTRLVVLCVDDTDDATRSTSTGAVSEAIADAVEGLGGCILLGITRHQLLLAEGVPYTSHNSSMCFAACMPEGAARALRAHAVEQVAVLSAASADPGLCVADMPARWFTAGVGGPAAWENAPAAERGRLAELAAFGVRAQREICDKQQAYELAAGIPWLELSEHGGTGWGVIGALAGVGLRLAGDDGRFRGKWDLADMLGVRNAALPAGVVRRALEAMACGAARVCDASGEPLSDDVLLVLDAEAKPVLSGGAVTLVCKMVGDVAVPARKADLDGLEDGPRNGRDAPARRAAYVRDDGGCGLFQPDNDSEEQRFAGGEVCANCLFRRKLADGLACMNPAHGRGGGGGGGSGMGAWEEAALFGAPAREPAPKPSRLRSRA